MAFTEAELLRVVTITGYSFSTLEWQVRYLGTNVTPGLEAAVRDELDRWDSVGGAFTQVFPMEANFGAKINPDAAKADIRRNIKHLLYLGGSFETAGTVRLYRS